MRNALCFLALACVLLQAVGPAPSFAQAESDSELKALNAQVIELHRAGKFAEAIPLAQRYADAMKARWAKGARYTCHCPAGLTAVSTGPNSYLCQRKTTVSITCTGGTVRNGQCLCPSKYGEGAGGGECIALEARGLGGPKVAAAMSRAPALPQHRLEYKHS